MRATRAELREPFVKVTDRNSDHSPALNGQPARAVTAGSDPGSTGSRMGVPSGKSRLRLPPHIPVAVSPRWYARRMDFLAVEPSKGRNVVAVSVEVMMRRDTRS